MEIKATPTAENIVDAAFLAKLAYDKNPTGAGSSWNLLGASKLGMTGAEWDSNTSDAETSPKFFDHGPAQKIVAQHGDTLAIAFRGTDSIAKLLIDLGSGVVSFLPYYSLFSTLIAKVESYDLNPVNSITSILVAGHSLGGAIVEELLNQTRDDPRFNMTGVTFGSPGSLGSGPIKLLAVARLH